MIDGLGQVLFAVPNHKCSLQLPADIRAVAFSFGLVDTALVATPKTDGVEFRIYSEGPNGQLQLIWSRALDIVAKPEDRGPQQATVTIDRAATNRLVFETAQRGTLHSDWSYWSNVSYRN